jgi:copper chaperone CopZ
LDYFIHQSLGRIRIKIPALKNNSFKIGLVKQILTRQDGVRRVSSNLITGSVVVNYDPATLLPGKIIDLFHSLGLLPNVVGFPGPYHSCTRLTSAALSPAGGAPTGSHNQAPEWLGEISKIVFKMMLDKALSHTGKVILKKIL